VNSGARVVGVNARAFGATHFKGSLWLKVACLSSLVPITHF